MKVGGVYHRHLTASLPRMAVVEYSIQQAVRRHFSLQLGLSLTMEVLVTRKKKGGQT